MINIWLALWALPDESANMVVRLVWNGMTMRSISNKGKERKRQTDRIIEVRVKQL